MSTLSKWAEDDGADEDDNILWDESTEEKLAENRGGFHLRKQNSGGSLRTIPLCKTPPTTGPRLITMNPQTVTSTTGLAPPAPSLGLLKKKDTKKASKFGLGERPLGSPVSGSKSAAQNGKINSSMGPKRRGTKTKSGSTDIGFGSACSGGSMNNSGVATLPESPEQVRRFLLSEVKQMSIERLVADAKRYLYLEEFHRKHTATSPPAHPVQATPITAATASLPLK
ncbi:hypothetical protein H310_01185 [Aphanomyces invadans]|uniref:Uncharacterized protein n=1 Tax=Aphanomyces invadans TaxID=157072 RepID=A0A024US00_9STRA|nr:hypothetical protein H310_01185 [Aphanomyces invadans]ETW08652.1 hypothetical protein H310_01185 [Aphanomyces invadans]|eukprot:XP_008862457.1 hypothetical protein H310_01185 [Aphanomyces invadans]